MGIGPVAAVPKALQLGRPELDDIDLIELNEAFAAQALAVIRELGFDEEIINVNGGAIALGHPLGCTGAKLTVHDAPRDAAPRRSNMAWSPCASAAAWAPPGLLNGSTEASADVCGCSKESGFSKNSTPSPSCHEACTFRDELVAALKSPGILPLMFVHLLRPAMRARENDCNRGTIA